MPVFSSARPTVLSREEEADLSKAALNPKLSAVDLGVSVRRQPSLYFSAAAMPRLRSL